MAAVVNSVKHANLISAIARAVARTADVPKPRGVAIEVLMQLLTLPREDRAALAYELIKPDPVQTMEEDDER